MHESRDTFLFQCQGGPLLPFLTMLLIAFRTKRPLKCSLEGYNFKKYGVAAMYALPFDDVPKDGQALFELLKVEGNCYAYFVIPRFLQLLEDEGYLVRGKTVVKQG